MGVEQEGKPFVCVETTAVGRKICKMSPREHQKTENIHKKLISTDTHMLLAQSKHRFSVFVFKCAVINHRWKHKQSSGPVLEDITRLIGVSCVVMEGNGEQAAPSLRMHLRINVGDIFSQPAEKISENNKK